MQGFAMLSIELSEAETWCAKLLHVFQKA